MQNHLRQSSHFPQPLNCNLTDLTVSHPLLGQGCVGTVDLFHKGSQNSLGEPHSEVLIPADKIKRVDTKSL